MHFILKLYHYKSSVRIYNVYRHLTCTVLRIQIPSSTCEQSTNALARDLWTSAALSSHTTGGTRSAPRQGPQGGSPARLQHSLRPSGYGTWPESRMRCCLAGTAKGREQRHDHDHTD